MKNQDIQLIKFCTYNVQKCSSSKLDKNKIILKKLIELFDVIFLQELQSTIENSDIEKLYDKNIYSHVLSDLTGRKKYKEKYCYIFKINKFNCNKYFTFDDEKIFNEDCFERNPFVIELELKNKLFEHSKFQIIGSHTKPVDSLNECNKLDDVGKWLITNTNCNFHIIMGDLNASGTYVRNENKLDLVIMNEKYFQITNDKMDTMVSEKSNNTYDRIFCTKNMSEYIVSVGVVNMEEMFDLTSQELKKISDHYPLEMTMVF